MDTKLKKYSHSIITKIVIFIIAIICLTGIMKVIVEVEIENAQLSNALEDHYFQSFTYVQESEKLVRNLTSLIEEYKNEEHILSGGTISEDEWGRVERNLFSKYQFDSRSYNPELSKEINYETFKQEYADEITQARDKMIKDDLKEYHLLLQNLEEYEVPLFYTSDGKNVFTNTTLTEKMQFETYPSYMTFEDYKQEIYPKETKENEYLYRLTRHLDRLDPENTVVYVAFTEEFLDSKIKAWQENKVIATEKLYKLAGFLIGFIFSFSYLILVIGRTSFKDQELHLNAIDKLYNEIKIIICIILIPIWLELVKEFYRNIDIFLLPITVPFAIVGLVLVLSVVKHFKNKSFIKHTLIFSLIYKIVTFVGDVYRSGSVGVKTVLIVIGYPILVALTFFMFPVTIGLAAWFAYKKIKSFNAIQEGVETIKDGNLHYRIEVGGKGEFGRLASNINSITDGLKNAVDNELKSERLKTELITNVSHDIRTPLTSIITYVDLLKKEKDASKVKEYIDVLDQKSKRLKLLTEDLFEAAKASSGNIPVNFERIDVVSLITQGLGEVNDKIEAVDLDIKLNHPEGKMYITADGKLLWRSIENLLSNILKYALRGSRVYIDIEDLGNEVILTFKNISAYELNISADELMERFKRGDESRSSEGNGLGLSIAKSLIDIQRGKFHIQIDGDLFKCMIYMPKHKSN
ncbi:two-component sensor histidine kinase [Desulfuribacillus stibiiarsenatis]|uniref:histidine kinase n=1 Tax=Desulfuribacillus stibiiarsenatis TaxID=1390249 RepID=A0A1E5L8A7_9FIRM|nr:HAMP domain-containing sensor histidine kinase [Desulfuribacillus stibiiarsenatis]OEH86392.1 two-component sensor histidine kinase [Desulfuribacillus stibiiarsenatis]